MAAPPGRRSAVLYAGLIACAPPPAPVAQTVAGDPCPTVAPAIAATVTPAVAPTVAPTVVEPHPTGGVAPSTPTDAGSPPAIGPVQGGPRGVRPCEFRESVDTYARSCTIKPDADGSLTVTAPGTALNPKNGFSFKMGGGPSTFVVSGELDAFNICRGPFSGKMATVQDGAARSYEVRFRDHCMIVIR
jgi:hypothetical protein